MVREVVRTSTRQSCAVLDHLGVVRQVRQGGPQEENMLNESQIRAGSEVPGLGDTGEVDSNRTLALEQVGVNL
jgi:hypothetical protein